MSATSNNLQGVRERIRAAVEAAQRAPDAVAKIAEVEAALPSDRPVRAVWHFIGPIQSNKTRAIAEGFDWVHGVERLKIAERLSAHRPPGRDALNVLIEVNLDGEASKSGVAPDDVEALARAVIALPRLRLCGLMTVPAPRAEHDAQRAVFATLRRLAGRLRDAGLPCEHLSMGMSADLEAAIAEGATMVRVGTAIFGARPVAVASVEGVAS